MDFSPWIFKPKSPLNGDFFDRQKSSPCGLLFCIDMRYMTGNILRPTNH